MKSGSCFLHAHLPPRASAPSPITGRRASNASQGVNRGSRPASARWAAGEPRPRVGVASRVVPAACTPSSAAGEPRHAHSGSAPSLSRWRQKRGVARREVPAAAGAAA